LTESLIESHNASRKFEQLAALLLEGRINTGERGGLIMDDRRVMGLGSLPPIGSPEFLRIEKKLWANHLRGARHDNPALKKFRPANR
jgi:hypothetical protein